MSNLDGLQCEVSAFKQFEFYYLTRLLDTELFIIITCKQCLGFQECAQLYG